LQGWEERPGRFRQGETGRGSLAMKQKEQSIRRGLKYGGERGEGLGNPFMDSRKGWWGKAPRANKSPVTQKPSNGQGVEGEWLWAGRAKRPITPIYNYRGRGPFKGASSKTSLTKYEATSQSSKNLRCAMTPSSRSENPSKGGRATTNRNREEKVNRLGKKLR